MPIEELNDFFLNIKLTKSELSIADRLIKEISARIRYLMNVGLPYLTLNRLSSTLSGGESQRINLSTALGSNLVGSMYILDEPSIGLHPRNILLLIDVLKELRDIGNTVIVVEHEEAIIRCADKIVDMGPEAGRLGGKIVHIGKLDLSENIKSLTVDYLTGRKKIQLPATRRKWNSFIEVIGARENNLKNVNVKFPLHILTAVQVSADREKSKSGSTMYYINTWREKINGENLSVGHFQKIVGRYINTYRRLNW